MEPPFVTPLVGSQQHQKCCWRKKRGSCRPPWVVRTMHRVGRGRQLGGAFPSGSAPPHSVPQRAGAGALQRLLLMRRSRCGSLPFDCMSDLVSLVVQVQHMQRLVFAPNSGDPLRRLFFCTELWPNRTCLDVFLLFCFGAAVLGRSPRK